MDRKKIIIISACILTAVLLIVAFLYFYKGTVVIEPKNDNATVSLNGKEYKDFPKTVKLKKGTYIIKTQAEGYISFSEQISVPAFKKTSFSPELKKATAVGYIPKGSFLSPTLTANNEVYYYNPVEAELERLIIDLTGINSGNETPSPISNNTLSPDSYANDPYIRWSPDGKSAIFAGGKTSEIINLDTKEIATALNNILLLDFISANKVIYSLDNSIYKSDLDFANYEKIAAANFNVKYSAVAPGGETAAFWNDDQFFIYDLKNKKTVKEFKNKVKKVVWQNDNVLALSCEEDNQLVIKTLSLNSSSSKTIKNIYSDDFAWDEKGNLLYFKEDKGNVFLTSQNIKSGNESTLYQTLATMSVGNIMVQGKIVIFSVDKTLYSLN